MVAHFHIVEDTSSVDAMAMEQVKKEKSLVEAQVDELLDRVENLTAVMGELLKDAQHQRLTGTAMLVLQDELVQVETEKAALQSKVKELLGRVCQLSVAKDNFEMSQCDDEEEEE